MISQMQINCIERVRAPRFSSMNFPSPISKNCTGMTASFAAIFAHSAFVVLALVCVYNPTFCHGIDGLPDNYEPIEEGHVDFSFCFEDGLWSMGIVHESGGDPGVPAEGTPREGELAPMIVRDQIFPAGSRGTRPVPTLWSFLGVGESQPYWTLPESNNLNVVFAGFSVCDIFDAVAYQETDPRVNSTEKWTTVTLRNVEYIGKKPGGGRFAMWSTDSFGAPTVWMTTENGVDATDTYFVLADGHSHPNLSFSALGLYAVTFDLTFYEGPGKTNPNTSPLVTYYFAVGTYWEWIARHFDPTNWFLQSTITGEQADPDKDGISNLIEYACDLDPTTADNREFVAAIGKGVPSISLNGLDTQVQFPQRLASTNPQIITTVQASSTLGSGSWAPSSGISTVAPLRTGWQTATHSVGAVPPALFLRLNVVLQNEITY